MNKIQTGIVRGPQRLWPDRQMLNMRYVDTVNIGAQGSNLVVNAITYRLNSLFDPLTTVTAEQPIAGFQEMSEQYSYYRVNAVKITVDITNLGGLPLFVACYPTNTAAVPTGSYATLLRVMGNPFTTWSTVSVAGGETKARLENYIKLKKVIGSNNYTTDMDFCGFSTGNPIRPIYGQVCVSSPVATGSYQYALLVSIEFYCEWFGRGLEST